MAHLRCCRPPRFASVGLRSSRLEAPRKKRRPNPRPFEPRSRKSFPPRCSMALTFEGRCLAPRKKRRPNPRPFGRHCCNSSPPCRNTAWTPAALASGFARRRYTKVAPRQSSNWRWQCLTAGLSFALQQRPQDQKSMSGTAFGQRSSLLRSTHRS